MTVLSSDNRLELFKVNIDKQESLIKKMARQEKRKVLKRKRQVDEESENDSVP